MKQSDMDEDNKVITKWQAPTEAISGTDVKVYFVKDGVETYVPEVRGVMYKGSSNRPTLVVSYIIFDHDPIEALKGSQVIRLKAATIQAPLCTCEFAIDSSEAWTEKTWGLTVDDIITEAHISLYARETKPWTKS